MATSFLRYLRVVGALLVAFIASSVIVPVEAADVGTPTAASSVYPPWQHGANNDALKRGLGFDEPDADNLADFHGDPQHPALSLFVGGNYFFAMAPLVAQFEKQYPQYKGHIYWETIPPGLLVKQMEAGGTVTVGNMTWTVKPDVYLAGLNAVKKQIDAGNLVAPATPYATNNLTIMVAAGNPKNITGLTDLQKADIKLAMPNPAFEGVAHQIQASLNKAGGDALSTAVYKTKLDDGSTQLTHIHHRQTPLWIMQHKVDAGVTWKSEALFQEQVGHPISHVDIPDEQNTTAIYAAAVAKGAPHAQAGEQWLHFIKSPAALSIFERYGFKPYVTAAK